MTVPIQGNSIAKQCKQAAKSRNGRNSIFVHLGPRKPWFSQDRPVFNPLAQVKEKHSDEYRIAGFRGGFHMESAPG
jgi:hypothetical protein